MSQQVQLRSITGIVLLLVLLLSPAWLNAAAPEKVTRASVEAQITETGNVVADQDERAAILDVYDQALEMLTREREWMDRVASIEATVSGAGELTKEIERELERPSEALSPGDYEDVELEELERRLTQAEADLTEATSRSGEIAAELKTLKEHIPELPDLLAEARGRLDQLSENPTGSGSDRLSRAQHVLAQARAQSYAAEVQALEAEVANYPTLQNVLEARLSRWERRQTQRRETYDYLLEIVQQQRADEAQDATDEANRTLRLFKGLDDENELYAYAEVNNEYAVERSDPLEGILAKRAAAVEKKKADEARFSELKADFDNTKDRVDKAGYSLSLGLMLNQKKASLDDTRKLKAALAKTRRKTLDVQDRLFKLKDALDSYKGDEAEAELLRSKLPEQRLSDNLGSEGETIGEMIGALAVERRQRLEALIADYEAYFAELDELIGTEEQLIVLTNEYANFIRERVLWIRSDRLFDGKDSGRALGWAFAPDNWRDAWTKLVRDVRDDGNLWLYLMALAAISALFVLWRRTLKLIMQPQGEGDETGRVFRGVIREFMLTILVSAYWPLVLEFFSWRLSRPEGSTAFTAALAGTLSALAIALFIVRFLNNILLKQGLLEDFFYWPGEVVVFLRRTVVRTSLVLIPALFFYFLLSHYQSEFEAYSSSLGRLAFVVAMAVTAFMVNRVLASDGPAGRELKRRFPRAFLVRYKPLLRSLMTWLMLGLGAAALVGYFFTAQEIAEKVYVSFILITALMLFKALLIHGWIFFERQKTRPARPFGLWWVQPPVEEKQAEQDEDAEIDVDALKAQAAQISQMLITLAMVIGLVLVWADVFPALKILDKVELYQTTSTVTETVTLQDGGEELHEIEKVTAITLGNVLAVILIGLGVCLTNRNVAALMNVLVFSRLKTDPGNRYAAVSLIKYGIMAIGIVWAFSALGIGWSKIQWLVAAVSVGVGFGLQEIFANVASGLIILFEKPVRLGDIVTVGTTTGKISRIRIRATTITDFNNKELIVPNKEFITTQLINWTLTDSVLRLDIPVGIAYGSDTQKAYDVLLEVAKDSPLVLSDPVPRVLFISFGDSSLVFELRVYVPQMDAYIDAKHRLHMEIDKRFREADIEISFPQMDLHFRSQDTPLKIQLTKDGDQFNTE